MKHWRIQNDALEVGVIEVGGHLDPVRFHTPGGAVEPMHKAPWVDEPEASPLPMLQNLRGDFFCAPFGASDVMPDESRPHGTTANGPWALMRAQPQRLELELKGRVASARVRKTLELKDNHPILYQVHEFVGGSGVLPLGHHAMLHASEPLYLSFSPWIWAGTPPHPVETDVTGGRSKLLYPQTLETLDRARTRDGNYVDLRLYPALDHSEEIVMLVSEGGAPFAWSAAVAPRAGWVWFALRDPAILRNTVLWLSNRGRDYPPFSGRHSHVLGIEEVTAYFHLGHKASSANNELRDRGFATTLSLTPETPLVVRYAFGLATIPPGFRRVATIEAGDRHLTLSDEESRHVHVPFDRSFFAAGRSAPRFSGPNPV